MKRYAMGRYHSIRVGSHDRCERASGLAVCGIVRPGLPLRMQDDVYLLLSRVCEFRANTSTW